MRSENPRHMLPRVGMGRDAGAGFRFIRLRPFETETSEGRSMERHRRVALSSGAALISKGVSAGSALITVPLTLSYLGAERYGLWMTISSVIVLMGFADLGMGNGLLNNIAASHGRDDREAARRYVSSAFFMLSGIALLIAIGFGIAYPFIDWPRVFNVSSPLAREETGPAVAVFVAFLCVNLPLDTVQRVQQGYQEGFFSHLWSVAGSILSLTALLAVIYAKGGLPWLVVAMSGGPALATVLNWVSVFLRSRPWLFPRIAYFSWSAAKSLVGSGALFVLLSLFSLAASSSDNLIIAHIMGPTMVAPYAVTQKIFLTVMLSQYFVAPLWPAFGESLARRDYVWARRTLRRALYISLAVGICTALPLILFGRALIRLWVGQQVTPSLALLVGFSAWLLLGGYGGVMSSFLNTRTSLLRRQVWFYGVAAVASVFLKIALARTSGLPGVIWASVIAFSVLYVVPAARLAFGYLSASGSAPPMTKPT